MLFDDGRKFTGLPEEGFGLFSTPGRESRRKAILDTIHPALEALGEDLAPRLSQEAGAPLHPHLPRLDWPRDYEPFCTWLALSRETQGYQAGPQLNVGVHADHVGVRLGWDTTADAFGRFEFLCRHGGLGARLTEVAGVQELAFRVYASAPWPEGSRCVFRSADDVGGSFDEVRRHGAWWELGRRFEVEDPADREVILGPGLGERAWQIFRALLPAFDRIAGGHAAEGD